MNNKVCPNCKSKFDYMQDITQLDRYHCFNCNYDTHPAQRLLSQYRYYRQNGMPIKEAKLFAHKDIEVN